MGRGSGKGVSRTTSRAAQQDEDVGGAVSSAAVYGGCRPGTTAPRRPRPPRASPLRASPSLSSRVRQSRARRRRRPRSRTRCRRARPRARARSRPSPRSRSRSRPRPLVTIDLPVLVLAFFIVLTLALVVLLALTLALIDFLVRTLVLVVTFGLTVTLVFALTSSSTSFSPDAAVRPGDRHGAHAAGLGRHGAAAERPQRRHARARPGMSADPPACPVPLPCPPSRLRPHNLIPPLQGGVVSTPLLGHGTDDASDRLATLLGTSWTPDRRPMATSLGP